MTSRLILNATGKPATEKQVKDGLADPAPKFMRAFEKSLLFKKLPSPAQVELAIRGFLKLCDDAVELDDIQQRAVCIDPPAFIASRLEASLAEDGWEVCYSLTKAGVSRDSGSSKIPNAADHDHDRFWWA